MKKRILSVILASLMLLVMLPTASASAATYYDLWVGGVQVTSDNADNVLGDGTVSFDEETYTLILDNADITGLYDMESYGIISFDMVLSIILYGDNTITTPDGCEYSAGIEVNAGDLYIYGGEEDATLTINCGDTITDSTAIAAYGEYDEYYDEVFGYIFIDDANVTAISGSADYTYGMYGTSIVVDYGSTVTATAANANYSSYGLYTSAQEVYDAELDEYYYLGGSLSVYEDCTLTATSGDAEYYSYGVCADNDIWCSGTLTAKSGDVNILDETTESIAMYASYLGQSNGTVKATAGYGYISGGVCLGEASTIESGKLSATSGEGSDVYGIRCVEGLYITDATVNASAADSTYSSVGIVVLADSYFDEETGEYYTYGGSLTIEGNSEVTATSGNAVSYSDAIIATSYEQSGGFVTATAGNVNPPADELEYSDSTALWTGDFAEFNGGTFTAKASDLNGVPCYAVSTYSGVNLADNMDILGSYTITPYSIAPTDASKPVIITDGVAPDKGLLGDVNQDGEVNVRDATAIQKHLASIITLSDEGLAVADYDGNGTINVKDATAIQKHLAGII
ncbi:MAG: dockerin type I repeat-containing protein [Ruminococcus sp.]|nr:dockerin type I repeat-containing protein [Ruminococcus sp.]